jgi:hypothetical protein
MKKQLSVWGSLALMLVAGAANAQQTLPERLSRETRDSLMLVIRQAQATGLPSDPLYAKAAEGVLKRADDARILLAVRNLSRTLADARAALPRSAAQSTIVAAANALQAGVEPGTIARYAAVSRSSEADLAVAYVTLADLIAGSVPVSAASNSVEQLLRNGVRESELASFRAAVVGDIQAGAKPEDALRARARLTRTP